MATSWQELTALTGLQEFTVSKVRLSNNGVTIEGDFELPPMARLSYEDQVFVAAFVRNHGSIKDMEGLFGISYPTVKGRLNRISQQLDFVKVETIASKDEILAQLERGEITADQAIERFRQ